MTSPRRGEPAGWARLLPLLAPLAMLAVLVAGCSSATPTPTGSAVEPPPSAGASNAPGHQHTVTRIEVRFAGGSVVGGAGRQVVPVGSPVELVVSSDVADEMHLHGYDKLVGVPAGGTATLSFVADVPGVFEVELERRATLLTRLEVR